MKRIIFLPLALLSIATTFACPAWDKPLYTQKQMVTNPYVTTIGFYPQGTPQTSFNVQCAFNQGVPVPYYVTIEVYGSFGVRYYNLLFNTGQGYKTFNFPLAFGEEIYPGLCYYTDYGPQ